MFIRLLYIICIKLFVVTYISLIYNLKSNKKQKENVTYLKFINLYK